MKNNLHKFILTTVFIVASALLTTRAFALPPEIQFDIWKLELVDQLKTENYAEAIKTIEKLKTLNLPLPASMGYFEGRSYYLLGKPKEGRKLIESYLAKEGKKAKYYKQSLNLLMSKSSKNKNNSQKPVKSANNSKGKKRKTQNRILVYNNGAEARYSIGGQQFVLAPDSQRYHDISESEQQLVFNSVLGAKQVRINPSKPMKYNLVTVNWSHLDPKDHRASIDSYDLQKFRFYNQADGPDKARKKLWSIRVRLAGQGTFSSNLLRRPYESRTSGSFKMPFDLRDAGNCNQVVRIEFADGHSFEQKENMCKDEHMFINYGNFF